MMYKNLFPFALLSTLSMLSMMTLFVIVTLFSGVTFFPFSAANAKSCHLTVGVATHPEQQSNVEIWTPVLHDLSEKTGCLFELKDTTTSDEFDTAMSNGAFDIAYVTPYQALIAHEAAGYIPLVRAASSNIRGIIVAHNESTIHDVHQLQGATIAFPSPNDLATTLLIRAELKQKFNIDIQPLYVENHSSVYLHTAKKLTDAGGGVMRTLDEQRASIQSKLHTVYTTQEIAAHPLVIHPRIEENMRISIQRAWLTMAQDNPLVFNGIPMTHPVKASMADYDVLEALHLEKFIEVSK
jgi:phosphonate transport system substrate-binding protein